MVRLIIPLIVFLVLAGIIGIFISHRERASLTCSSTLPTPKIVAFGDSLVFGYGATNPGGFVTSLGTQIGVPIVNLGKSGDTTADAITRLPSVEAQIPAITIVLLGGNDALQKLPQAQTEANLNTIVGDIQKTGSRVVLLGVIGGFPDPYASMFKRVAEEHKVTYVSNVLSGIIGHEDLMSDSVHPNQAGYQKISDRLAPILQTECGKL